MLAFNIFGEQMEKKAFTLAEVLITLGIIGVVAALVLPNAVKHSQEFAWRNAAKKQYTVFSQAYGQILNDNAGSLAGVCTGASPNYRSCFVNLFESKMKFANKCLLGTDTSVCYNLNYKRMDNADMTNGGLDGAAIMVDMAGLVYTM